MKKGIYCGVDIGLDGALVVIKNGKIESRSVMPIFKSTKSRREYDTQKICNFFRKIKNGFVVIEKCHAMPKLGTVQSFNLGKGFGLIIGIVSALNLPYHIVHARTWQKEMFKDLNYKDTKQASKIVAKRLFPNENFLATERCRKEHSGLTDATLISVWGKRNNL